MEFLLKKSKPLLPSSMQILFLYQNLNLIASPQIVEIQNQFKSLHIFILHRLRNKFLQLILISLDSASWELHQYSRRMCGPMKNPKVETRSRDSNLGPHDCKADALPHDHGHHQFASLHKLSKRREKEIAYITANGIQE